MKTIAFRPSSRHAAIGLPLAVAVALLSGCTSGDGGSPKAQGAVTPPVTASIAAAAAAAAAAAPAPVTATGTSAPAPATATAKADTPKSDVVGRKFDVGTIVSVERVRGVPVLVFDRYTFLGMPDTEFATKGVKISSHQDAWFQNLNSKVTYRIPVAQGAVFTRLTCVLQHDPSRRPATLGDFTRLQPPANVIVLTLDRQGRVVKAENDTAC